MKIIKRIGRSTWISLLASFAALMVVSVPAAAQKKPNTVVIMGDDVGIWNIGAYHRGTMSGKTPSTSWPRWTC
jgi:hypothetical protein